MLAARRDGLTRADYLPAVISLRECNHGKHQLLGGTCRCGGERRRGDGLVFLGVRKGLEKDAGNERPGKTGRLGFRHLGCWRFRSGLYARSPAVHQDGHAVRRRGADYGVLIAVGIAIAGTAPNYAFAKKPLGLFGIEMGYVTVSIILMSGILALMQ